ncbi:MAG: group I intron-associated PD-(D/E)XK endonuclease [Bacteroidia bacterium]
MTKNSSGIVGLTKAIEWFSKNDYTISLPLVDSQSYDLVVEKNCKLQTVQVKYTGYKRVKEYRKIGYYQIAMNKGYTIKSFDYLFIHTVENVNYLLKVSEIKNFKCITLYPKYDKYIVS